MARIRNLRDDRWYVELNAVAFYGETEFEERILQHAQEVFPYHFVFPLKRDVANAAGTVTKRPDLALIRKDLVEWAVVEVEIQKHPLKHVLDQTRVFLDGDYNAPALADYVKKQLGRHCHRTVSLKRLRQLFGSKAPTVLVVVDTHDAEWEQKLNQTGVGLCVFEVYKNASGQFVYRTFGQYPVVAVQEAQCRVSMANVLEVVGEFQFTKVRKNSLVEVEFDQQKTRWVLFEDAGRQYLRLAGTSSPLSPTETYGLFKDKTDRYFFKRS